MNTVEKVLAIAEVEVGYLEKSRAAYQKDKNILYEKTKGAGSDNYTKYGKEMHDIYPAVMDFPASWCDAFVDWCFQKAYGVANAKGLLGGNFDDYTPNSANLYKKKNAYHKTPKVGDQIFFKNSTRICHTGLVYKVDSSKVYTIEGNTSGASGVIANGGGVCKKSYSLSYSGIDGYGRPNYEIEKSEEEIFLFDAEYYNNKYFDLRKLIGDDKEKLFNHFQNYGRKEGRRASILFDPRFYSEKYPDLKKAFGKDWERYYIHFLNYGMKEGRASSEDFDLVIYKDRYPDLKKAFGTNYPLYYKHFCLYGIKEGRKAN